MSFKNGDDVYAEDHFEDEFENYAGRENFPRDTTESYIPTAVDHACPSTSLQHTEFRPHPLMRNRFTGVQSQMFGRGGSVPRDGRLSTAHRLSSSLLGHAQARDPHLEPHALSTQVNTWLSPLEEQAKRRKLQREFSKPYLSEMANAHAELRTPVIHVPTTTTCKPIGLRSAWHRQVRLVARQNMDQSIRSYRGKKGAWWKAVDKIYVALGEIFTYDYPLCVKYLSKYLKGAVKNDRLEWKEFFFAHKGAQHEKCPDEAFGTLRKY